MNNEKRYQIFERLRQQNPSPTTELKFDNHYQLLIAVMLSAQATDVSVNKACLSLFKTVKTPEAMVKLGLLKLKKAIKTIGLYNTKATNVINTSKLLIKNHNGQVPDDRESLESLPGVGRKTANVVLNTAFGVATIAVDTHIFRVANRINIAPGKNVLAVEKKLLKVISDKHMLNAHHWLILHGRYTCIARKPRCGSCIIEDLCEYKDKQIE